MEVKVTIPPQKWDFSLSKYFFKYILQIAKLGVIIYTPVVAQWEKVGNNVFRKFCP